MNAWIATALVWGVILAVIWGYTLAYDAFIYDDHCDQAVFGSGKWAECNPKLQYQIDTYVEPWR